MSAFSFLPAANNRSLADLTPEEVSVHLACFSQSVSCPSHEMFDELNAMLAGSACSSDNTSTRFDPFSNAADPNTYDENVFDCEWDTCALSFRSQHDLCEHLQADHLVHTVAPFHCRWRSCERHPDAATLAQNPTTLLSSALPITHDDPRAGSFRPFPKRNKLVMHVRTHTGERPFRCEECGRGFARADGLASHRKRHEKRAVTNGATRRSNPSVYGERRARGSRDEHAHHQITDTPASMIPFSTPELVQDDATSVTVVGGVGVWACRVCSRRFSEFPNLRAHETEAHPNSHRLCDADHQVLTDPANLVPLQALVEDAVKAFGLESLPSASMAYTTTSLPSNQTPPPMWQDAPMSFDAAEFDATFWAMMAEQQFQDMMTAETVPTKSNSSSQDEFLTPASYIITESMTDDWM